MSGMRQSVDDRSRAAAYFAQVTRPPDEPPADLFVITDLDELRRQHALAELLAAYPVFARGDGFSIYDLRRGGSAPARGP
jgi:hypothetical protein